MELKPHADVRASVRIGQRMMCVAGRVWITQDGNWSDWVLGPGQVQQFDRSGPVLIRALERAQLAMDVGVPAGEIDGQDVGAVSDPRS